MNISWLLPYEITVLKTDKTMDEIREALLGVTDQTKLYDTRKEFRGSLDNEPYHLKTNLGFFIKTNHYYFYFIDTAGSGTTIRLVSRNSTVQIAVYLIAVVIGLGGIIALSLSGSFFGILFVILWLVLIWGLSNGIPKIVRKEDIALFRKILAA